MSVNIHQVQNNDNSTIMLKSTRFFSNCNKIYIVWIKWHVTDINRCSWGRLQCCPVPWISLPHTNLQRCWCKISYSTPRTKSLKKKNTIYINIPRRESETENENRDKSNNKKKQSLSPKTFDINYGSSTN